MNYLDFDPNKETMEAILPNGDRASTTCIDFKKLARALGIARPISAISIDTGEVFTTLQSIGTPMVGVTDSVLHAAQNNARVITAIDILGNYQPLMTIATDNASYIDALYQEVVEGMQHLMVEEYNINFDLKMHLKNGSGVYYNVYKDKLLEIATQVPVDVEDVQVRVTDAKACEYLYSIEPNTPYELKSLLTLYKGCTSPFRCTEGDDGMQHVELSHTSSPLCPMVPQYIIAALQTAINVFDYKNQSL